MESLNLLKLINNNFKYYLNSGDSKFLTPSNLFLRKEDVNLDVVLSTRRYRLEFFEGCQLVANLQENIDKADWIVDKGPFYELQIPLLFLCLIVADCHLLVDQFFVNWTVDEIQPLQRFICQYQQGVTEVLIDEDLSLQLLKDVADFFGCLIFASSQESLDSFNDLVKKNDLPPWLPLTAINKLLVLQLHPARDDVVYQLQLMRYPRLFLLQTNLSPSLSLPPMTTELFHEICLTIPDKLRTTSADFITEFQRIIWQPHIFPDSRLRLLTKKPVFRVEDGGGGGGGGYSTRDLFIQVLIFGLPNWYQVWSEMGLPTTFEIQRRLWFWKKRENWRPPVKEFIRFCLQY